MNNCNGQGTCDDSTNGQCVCNAGYKFADCSKQELALTQDMDTALYNHGPYWYTMSYAGSDPTTVYINPNITSQVYFKKGATSTPTNFDYDMSFMNVNGTHTFDSDALGLTNENGYAVSIYMPAYNDTAALPEDQLLYGGIQLYFQNGAASLGFTFTALAAIAASSLF